MPSLSTLLRTNAVVQEEFSEYFLHNRIRLKKKVFDDLEARYLRPFLSYWSALHQARLEMIAKALSEWNLYNYSVSLLQSWNVIEGYVGSRWDTNNPAGLGQDQPSVYKMIEDLATWKAIPATEQTRLTPIRRARNAYIHEAQPIFV